MLTEKTKNAIIELQKLYPERRSALIPALHMAQSEVGYLPVEVQAEVAALFAIEPSEVQGIVSFYDMFFDRPVGKKIIFCCKNLSCMLHGSDQILSALCTKLNVKPGEVSADGNFTVFPCECLAACDRAPAMIIGDTLVGPVTENELDALINENMPS